MTELRAKVLTVSDGVVGGTREDKSGDALGRAAHGPRVTTSSNAASSPTVSSPLRKRCARSPTASPASSSRPGGTGFGPRDLTPEGTRAVIEREAPGIVEAIRRISDDGGRGFGMLSRAVAGARGAALVCNLPGSSGGAIEGLEVLLPVAPHALELLAGGHPH